MKRLLFVGIVATMLAVLAVPAFGGDEPKTAPEAQLVPGHASGPGAQAPTVAPEWKKPIPIGFSIDYTLVTDYIWRGINLSEYAGEGRERLNHQMTTGFSIDTKPLLGTDLGTIAGSVWFEWYAGQDDAEFGGGAHHLQEVDYTLSWSYDIPKLPLAVELGWIAYQFPWLGGDDGQWTHEVYATLSLDDSCIFGKPILNPYVSYYLDVDDVRGSWIEIGVSHDFPLAECGLGNTPVLKDVTLTPSLVLGIDHRYYDKVGLGGGSGTSTRLGNLQYGLDAVLDLSSLLGIPEKYGSLSLTGFLYYSQAFHDESPAVNDEFWGGVTIGYEW